MRRPADWTIAVHGVASWLPENLQTEEDKRSQKRPPLRTDTSTSTQAADGLLFLTWASYIRILLTTSVKLGTRHAQVYISTGLEVGMPALTLIDTATSSIHTSTTDFFVWTTHALRTKKKEHTNPRRPSDPVPSLIPALAGGRGGHHWTGLALSRTGSRYYAR